MSSLLHLNYEWTELLCERHFEVAHNCFPIVGIGIAPLPQCDHSICPVSPDVIILCPLLGPVYPVSSNVIILFPLLGPVYPVSPNVTILFIPC
jgi:hypothetical protein